jgi:hypothetical protein
MLKRIRKFFEESEMPKGEIKLRGIGVLVILGIFLFIALACHTFWYPFGSALLILFAFFYGVNPEAIEGLAVKIFRKIFPKKTNHPA